MSEDPSRSKCSCGTGDGTGDYIECDNETCKVGWYHWECVQVTGPLAGTWLCPSCSPSAAFYIKQLVQNSAAPSPVLKVEKTDGPTGREPATSSSAPKPTKTAERADYKAKGKQPVPKIKEKEMANKGVAVRKPAAKKPKPKWVGWVELTSDGEEDFKKKVDAQWSMEDSVIGKRTRGSKAMDEDNETSSRTLRRQSRLRRNRQIVRTDSDEEQGESSYRQDQQEAADSQESVHDEKEKQEVRVQRRASIIEIPSDVSNDSEDIMGVNQGPNPVESRKSDEHSDPLSDSREERQDYQGLVQAEFPTGRRDRGNASDFEAEDPEDTMNMGYQDGIPIVGGSHPSDGSEYGNDDNSSTLTKIRTIATNVREVADSTSPPPVSLPANHLAGPSAVSPILQVSGPATRPEDALDISEDKEDHGEQVSETTTPVVDFAVLYKRQGNRWGEFSESTIRTTLPRLG